MTTKMPRMPHEVRAAVPAAGKSAIAAEQSAGESQIAARPVVA